MAAAGKRSLLFAVALMAWIPGWRASGSGQKALQLDLDLRFGEIKILEK